MRNSERGFILLMTFIVMSVLTAVAISYLHMTVVRTRALSSEPATDKAFWLAEAGMQQYAYLLKTDEEYRNDYPTFTGTLGGGTYTVQLLSIDTGPETTYYLESTGTIGGISKSITQSVAVIAGSDAFEYAVHAGDGFSTWWSDVDVNGNYDSNETDLPVVDLSYYEGIADHVLTGNQNVSAGTYSGIYYVKGDVTFNDNVTVNGSVIVEGSVDANWERNITINATSPYPAIIANGNISFWRTEDITINGLIYAGADGSGDVNFSVSEDVDITGTIVAAGDISMNFCDNMNIDYDGGILIDPPPGIVTETTLTLGEDWSG